MQLTPGTLLERGKYRVIETLGRGGFGVTYLAEQVMAKRKVCIKEFFPKDYYKRDGDTGALTLSSDGFAESMNRFKAKFIKEAQTIATLNHANIIPIYDIFEENGTAYYVMDYIEGESLSERVKCGGAMSERDAVAYIKQVASALEHIHEQQIMHLDVKPGNIMVRSKDDRAILIDFGLSKHYDATSGEATSTTPVGVSHGYAPMEQYQDGGVSTFSPETDIYSLGATLYYLVTGCVPPLAADIADDGLPALPDHLSSSVRTAIERSMAEKRKERPHTIKEFLALLDNNKPIMEVHNDESEKTNIAPQATTPKQENKENKSTQKKRRWWMWMVIIFATVGGIYYGIGKYLQSEGKGFYGVYDVGDYFNQDGKEGVVFYVSHGGRHGKIVSLEETVARWCTYEQSTKGIKLGLIHNGKTNTDKVMKRDDNDQYPAFFWCREKGADWYLPAMNELRAICENREEINSTLKKHGANLIFSDEYRIYWSSTECEEYDPHLRAWHIRADNGNNSTKNNDYYVRAVSDF